MQYNYLNIISYCFLTYIILVLKKYIFINKIVLRLPIKILVTVVPRKTISPICLFF